MGMVLVLGPGIVWLADMSMGRCMYCIGVRMDDVLTTSVQYLLSDGYVRACC